MSIGVFIFVYQNFHVFNSKDSQITANIFSQPVIHLSQQNIFTGSFRRVSDHNTSFPPHQTLVVVPLYTAATPRLSAPRVLLVSRGNGGGGVGGGTAAAGGGCSVSCYAHITSPTTFLFSLPLPSLLQPSSLHLFVYLLYTSTHLPIILPPSPPFHLFMGHYPPPSTLGPIKYLGWSLGHKRKKGKMKSVLFFLPTKILHAK